MLKLTLDEKYGPFRVYDANENIVKTGGMTESEATDLAITLNGRIEHQDPDTFVWFNW